jgi:hypothetical protein
MALVAPFQVSVKGCAGRSSGAEDGHAEGREGVQDRATVAARADEAGLAQDGRVLAGRGQ